MALKNNAGFIASCAVHGVALVFLMLNFTPAPKFNDAEESVPVEMITASELNQVTNGEKTAKPLPVPQRRVDKIAAVTESKPLPPIAEAKKDIALPPSPAKPQADPGQDDKPVPTPPQRVAALPPEKPAPEKPAVSEPEPPRRPAPEPPKAVEDKPPPPDAEAVEPKPVPRPKQETKTDLPKPPEKRPVVKEVKTPEPPKKPEPKFKPDELAKLLKDTKDDKPAVKPKAGNEAKEPPRRDFDPNSISALLDHDAPQRKASTGQKLTQEASLGLPTAHAATLSPSMMAQLDQILIDQYHGCWSYFGLGAAQNYVPEVRVHLAQDGSLSGTPTLLNPPTDPNLRSLADSALRAVEKCNPLKIPERFTPFYDQWANRRVRFDPHDML
ncbi:MAG: cell envelope biogenesis protein TolA [Beijerinckiaceae bacterium]|nr:cell envelope biogenesis protein TolA [Beijerinckiaceae bacterium]